MPVPVIDDEGADQEGELGIPPKFGKTTGARGGRGEKGNVEMGIKQLTKLIGDAAPDAIKVGP